MEYVALVLRQLKVQKVALAVDPKAAARVFQVPKRNGNQREVWDGGRLTRAAQRPPPPPYLANPGALAELEASHDLPLWMSGRDAESFFDQLALPAELQPFFGRPFVTVTELLTGTDSEAPLPSLDAVRQHLVQDHCIDADSELCPVSRVWPMGFGWSSFVAQSVMIDTLIAAKFLPGQFLTEEGALPLPGMSCVSIATDDVIHFQRASPMQAEQLVSPLARLDEEWRSRGLISQPSKSFDLESDGVCLGVELVSGTCLAPKASRLSDIMCAIIALMRHPWASPGQVASLLGMLQWNDLMSRGLLSIFSSAYAFTRLLPENECVVVWPSVVSELALNVALCCFWVTDLTRPWWPFIVSTDASSSYGFGMTIASLPPDQVRAAASAAGSSSTYFRLASDPPDSKMRPRRGTCYRLPLRARDFKTVLSIRARLSPGFFLVQIEKMMWIMHSWR